MTKPVFKFSTFAVQEVERNAAGKRIVKVSETGKTRGGETATVTTYVVHQPSRLVMVPVRGEKGRFTKETRVTSAPATTDFANATGWIVLDRFDTLAAARASLGINTQPKRATAVAAALKLAA